MRLSSKRPDPARPRPPAPMQVVQLDLDGPDGPVLAFGPPPGDAGGPAVGGDVFALVRLRGRPVDTVVCRVPPGRSAVDAVAAAARARLTGRQPPAPSPSGGDLPRTSVVVATRDGADRLARTLDSLLAQGHPDFEVVVVDNASATRATRDLVRHKYSGLDTVRVRYVREPVPGLATAHNRGVAVADGMVLAFTDDDVVADPHWLTALTRPFADDPRLGCTTGLILPARLRTPAQILLESHGGFAKGFAPRVYDPRRPPADQPLFPFTAGSFGSGANMAFRATALRRAGGFDPATGTGTPARGGDDLYAFVAVLMAGHRLRYAPEALVWHHHRETWQDLADQTYGYGVGLTASLTALLVRRPGLLPALLRRLPAGLAHARAITARRESGTGTVPGPHGTRDHPWPRHLSRLERRGMLAGPFGYAHARLRLRATGAPAAPDEDAGRG
ncbi:glycosyltransferase family 2 protein [Streptomyces peucetius]|uniref:Glycosyltransferase family 2 protein n=2 Tax=Streptomyces peucetius TaxID=1950 RepID=A0ABY6I933_STRPE|nr:glycosyltransferase family 2 protein [Streptomyces peucetius]UYQ62497.1 glycosyltransferase family 2 protein [Streptomyces peucetius]